MMKRNPNDVFAISHLKLSSQTGKVYLNTLISLGLVERCRMIYYVGVNHYATRVGIGYRLKKKNDNKSNSNENERGLENDKKEENKQEENKEIQD